jgi:hypothetical protein
VCVERERERDDLKKKNGRLVCKERKREAIFFLFLNGDMCIYIYIHKEREREREGKIFKI